MAKDLGALCVGRFSAIGAHSPREAVVAGAQAARKAIARSENTENSIPSLHRIISAVGVDPQTQELWIAIGTLLMRFDKDGQRLSSFRTYLPSGARLEASQILVEPDRLLIAADTQGIYEFAKPKKLPQ